MSTAPKAAAFAVLLRIFYGAYPSLQQHWWGLFWVLAAVSMTLGNLAALRQQSVKRMLAYSSIAHAGYLLVAFTAFSPQAVAAASFYALCYAAMNVGIFAIISHAGGYNEELWSIADYRGLAYRAPVLAGAMAFFLLSLIGIPFTGGFFAKFYVFSAALQQGMTGLAVIGLLNSGIACYYYLRLLTAVYSKPADGAPVMAVPRMSLTLGLAILLSASATLLLGVVPRGSLDLAQRGARVLFPDSVSPFASAEPAAAPSSAPVPKGE
jgi:NADH-quinone oxidoreductase subunit N